MKNEVFNPADWNSAPVEKVPAALSPSVAPSSNPPSKGVVADRGINPSILAVVDAVEASGIDITPTYSEWLAIGFALVAELGEDGRAIFHRLSRFNPEYDYNEADRQYSHCLSDGSREITIASLFHIAQTHGVGIGHKPMPTPASSQNQVEEVEEDEEVRKTIPSKNTSLIGSNALSQSNSVSVGTFSQSVREQLPDILKRIVADAVSEVDADLLILGSLTVFSACLPNVYGVYDRREVFSNLFLYVTASASAGKGRLSLCRHLVAPLHRELREQYRKSMEKYKQEQLQYVLDKKKGEGKEPEEPPFLTLFIPANSTATVVYQTLNQNNGVGLLFETEGDTLANAFNSDLGNYSDGFRKAFHHETISYLRKKDREYVEILKPKFSAILSGTPEQVFNLIPSAENGLFSRFIFYVMPTEIVWHDMFDDSDGPTADELFKEIGRDFYQFHKLLAAQTIRFTLTTDQQHQFNAFFSQTQAEYAALFGNDIIASVRRLGLILFRFAMILTVLRQMDAGTFPLPSGNEAGQRPETVLFCADADFATALAMVKILLQHTVTVFQALPRRAERRFRQDRRQRTESHMQTFLAALPESFDRPTYLKTASDIGINEKTAERYITDLCRSGQLDHPASGQYAKPSNT
ncbi:MAG: DUF3987 domain-containing protein [Bacteroidales bacterium]|nr:DUF3987 domain-containing protein [Bacteroidales bacterium]